MKNASLFPLFFSLLFPLGLQAQNTLRLNAGQSLKKGQKIEVAGKGYLILQTDGNLVAYDAANRARWATGTNGYSVTEVMMHSQGMLALHDPVLFWFSNKDNPQFMNSVGTYFEINLTTWRAFISTSDGSISKELLTGTLLKKPVEDNNLRDGITARPSSGYMRVMQADGTLGYVPIMQDSTICKVVTNTLKLISKSSDRLEGRDLSGQYNGTSEPSEPVENTSKRDHEVTFFCQAGYVSRFELSYSLNGQNKIFSTNNLPVGQLQSFKVPWNATNIVAKGFMLSAGEHPIFNEKLSAPTDVCYKTYGTIFDRRWSKCN